MELALLSSLAEIPARISGCSGVCGRRGCRADNAGDECEEQTIRPGRRL